MPINLDKYVQQRQAPSFKLTNVWKFIIGYILLQFLFVSFLYGIFGAIFEILICWIPILLLPCLLKYCFKKRFTKKQAIVYTVIFGIVLLLGNVIVDILVKSINPKANTTTIWNLIMMIIPYYLLTDEPIFSQEKSNNSTKN